MEEKISLEASGMPGVIKTMEKHFGKLIKEASAVKTVPTSVIVGAPDKGNGDFYVEGYEKDGKLVVTEIGTPEPISNEGEWTHVMITKKLEPEMYSMMLCRDYMNDEFEVLVEILDYHSKEQGGCWDEVIGPTIEMGDAFTLQGKQIELTELELERAAEGALAMIESRK